MGRPRLDLTGANFGELTVLRRGTNRRQATLWWCRCSCGSEHEFYTANLRGGLSKRCRDCAKGAPRSHGMTRSPEHSVWLRIRNSGACCERWLSFENFLDDVGRRPSCNHTFERIQRDQLYSPGNAQWMSPDQKQPYLGKQVTFNGKRQNLSAWTRELGISREGLRQRIRKLGIERALAGDLPGREASDLVSASSGSSGEARSRND